MHGTLLETTSICSVIMFHYFMLILDAERRNVVRDVRSSVSQEISYVVKTETERLLYHLLDAYPPDRALVLEAGCGCCSMM